MEKKEKKVDLNGFTLPTAILQVSVKSVDNKSLIQQKLMDAYTNQGKLHEEGLKELEGWIKKENLSNEQVFYALECGLKLQKFLSKEKKIKAEGLFVPATRESAKAYAAMYEKASNECIANLNNKKLEIAGVNERNFLKQLCKVFAVELRYYASMTITKAVGTRLLPYLFGYDERLAFAKNNLYYFIQLQNGAKVGDNGVHVTAISLFDIMEKADPRAFYPKGFMEDFNKFLNTVAKACKMELISGLSVEKKVVLINPIYRGAFKALTTNSSTYETKQTFD